MSDIAQNYRILQSGSVFVPALRKNFALSPCSEALSNKITIQIKVAGMSVIFYYIKRHLSYCNGS
jgi:hypothetical protein